MKTWRIKMNGDNSFPKEENINNKKILYNTYYSQDMVDIDDLGVDTNNIRARLKSVKVTEEEL